MADLHRASLIIVKQEPGRVSCQPLSDSADNNSCRGCSSVMCKPAGPAATMNLPLLPDSDQVNVGDRIELLAPGSMLLTLSSVIYLSPVLLMLFFMACCSVIFPASEAVIAVSAALGLGLGLAAIAFSESALRSFIAKYLIVRSGV